MEENIKLVKEFSHTAPILRQGIRAYQKKYIMPMSYVKMVLYLVLAVVMACGIIFGNMGNAMRFAAYLVIAVAFALIFRCWYNPMKLRDSVVESLLQQEDSPVYRLTVREKEIEIAIVSEIVQEKSSEESENDEYSDEIPEPSIISIDNNLSIIEEDKLFIIAYGKSVYYIIPTADFSSAEMEIMRNISN